MSQLEIEMLSQSAKAAAEDANTLIKKAKNHKDPNAKLYLLAALQEARQLRRDLKDLDEITYPQRK